MLLSPSPGPQRSSTRSEDSSSFCSSPENCRGDCGGGGGKDLPAFPLLDRPAAKRERETANIHVSGQKEKKRGKKAAGFHLLMHKKTRDSLLLGELLDYLP